MNTYDRMPISQRVITRIVGPVVPHFAMKRLFEATIHKPFEIE